MTCELWRTKLDAYADAELPQQELLAMDAQLAYTPRMAAARDRVGAEIAKLALDAAEKGVRVADLFVDSGEDANREVADVRGRLTALHTAGLPPVR